MATPTATESDKTFCRPSRSFWRHRDKGVDYVVTKTGKLICACDGRVIARTDDAVERWVKYLRTPTRNARAMKVEYL